MNLNTLQGFRHKVYGCFEQAADALFNTVDALSTETQAHSFPELSLSWERELSLYPGRGGRTAGRSGTAPGQLSRNDLASSPPALDGLSRGCYASSRAEHIATLHSITTGQGTRS
jgi:hypothetical protein